MASTVEESNTADDLSADDTTQDRYSVSFQAGKDAEEGSNNSGSIDRYSVNHNNQLSKEEEESSFDSRTYGESTFVTYGESTFVTEGYDGESTFVTEGYDGESTFVTDAHDGESTLVTDAFDEELSLESQQMLMDHFVDNTCSCLNYPSILYQNMCMQTETSLLRESKGVTRSTIYNNRTVPTKLGIAAAKRRNVRIQSKPISKDERVNDAVSSAGHTTGSELRREEIQPKRDLDSVITEISQENKCYESETASQEVVEDAEAKDTPDCDSTSNLDTPSMSQSYSEDSQESQESEPSEHSEDEIEKVDTIENVQTIPTNIKEMVERAIEKAAKEEQRDILIRVPKNSNETDVKLDPPETLEMAGENLVSQDESTPDEPEEKEENKTVDVIETSEDPTQIGERIWSVPITEHTTRVEDSEEDEAVEDPQEQRDEASVISHEIINLVSLDDQDSWTPADYARHRQLQTHTGSPIHISSDTRNDQHNNSRIASASSAVDELWMEEETKLNVKRSPSRGLSASQKELATAKSAEALWNEERRKLQTISDVAIRSQSRRQLIQKVLEGTRTEEIFSNEMSEENLRAGRSRSSADRLSRIEISRSIIQERGLTGRSMLLQRGHKEYVSPVSSRSRDLAARKLEEAQKIWASKRAVSPQKTTMHRYSRESPSRSLNAEHSDTNSKQQEVNVLMRSLSEQRSRNTDLIGVRFVDDSANKNRRSEGRDDHEFPTSFSAVPPVEKNWSNFDTTLSATEEIRKLEKKVERRVRRADVDSRLDPATEKIVMDQRLSNKLRSIMKADDMNAQKMSSKDIRKLEMHLAQTLNSESENRSSRLKKIKHKERQRFTQQVPPGHTTSPELKQSNIYSTKTSHRSKQYLQESRDRRPESSRHGDIKSIRTRYVRRGTGHRRYSRMPDLD